VGSTGSYFATVFGSRQVNHDRHRRDYFFREAIPANEQKNMAVVLLVPLF
jgi:hypothetical protein